MTKRKILYGICGIGTGHTNRQLPIVEHFVAQGDQLVIFAYGESLVFYEERYAHHANVTVLPVSVPFYVGDKKGIDFAATAKLAKNNGVDHNAINTAALARAQELIGKPDLVVSDYEPISAQYAYATGTRLVTVDQQSKYLVGDFSNDLNGQSYKDEVAKLRMFFPGAYARVACSFFRVKPLKGSSLHETVLLYPPILKESIVAMKRSVDKEHKSILVYISSQQDFVQELTEVVSICAGRPEVAFHIFLPKGANIEGLASSANSNVALYRQGDQRFSSVLSSCSGIITTGGHTLLAEAMHLGIPAYVIPLPVYEQAMNAWVIEQNGFGVSRPTIAAADLAYFLDNIDKFSLAIEADSRVLLRRDGRAQVIEFLESALSPSGQ